MNNTSENKAKKQTKFAKTLRTIYLFEDGHAVAIHSETHEKSGITNEWAELYERLVPSVCLPVVRSEDGTRDYQAPRGRIIFSSLNYDKQGLANLILRAERIYVTKYDTKYNTKLQSIGIDTQIYIEIQTKDFQVNQSYHPGLTSCDTTWQPENGESWQDVKDNSSWGMYRIAKVHSV